MGTDTHTEEKPYTKSERMLESAIVRDLLSAINTSVDDSEIVIPDLLNLLNEEARLDDFLRALATKLSSIPDLNWKLVSLEAQKYYNALANAVNENESPLPLPPDLPTAEGLIEDPSLTEGEGEQGEKRALRGWAARPPSHTERVRKVIVTHPHLSLDELTAKVDSMGLHITHSSIRAVYYHCYRTLAVLAEEKLLDSEYAKNFKLE